MLEVAHSCDQLDVRQEAVAGIKKEVLEEKR